MFVGFLTTLVISAIGALLILISMIAWGLEGSESTATPLTGVTVIGGGDAEDKLVPGARVITRDGQMVGRVTQASQDSPLVRQGWSQPATATSRAPRLTISRKARSSSR